jgi:SAM-dependent methyltransferase
MTPATYDSFAALYDRYTRGYQAERWTEKLEMLAQPFISRGGRLLDVGCGTGKSFLPMLDRGWRVVGCDLSPAMLDVARSKVPASVRLEIADMRELPRLGTFDLVWALNDAVNNLLGYGELETAIESMKRNLALGGGILFDLNTYSLCRAVATEIEECSVEGEEVRWTGLAEEFEPAGISQSRFEILGKPAATCVHRQRHFPEKEVLKAIAAAGLTCWGVWGDDEGAQEQPLDEGRHQKAIYLAGETLARG